jgi:hypothetical protein
MANHTTVFISLWIVWSAVAIVSADDAISFNRDVRPILSDRCFHCHGPDADNQDSEFRLDTLENATADLGGYVGVAPGDLDSSELHVRIRSEEDDQMPPPESVRKLTAAERDILDAWIEAGAPFDSHWSFQPIPQQTNVPDVGNQWARNDVDRFIIDTLTQRGMTPSEESSREKWIRRVTFDLTGLPPTLHDIDLFLIDGSDDAHDRVVDRLLGSDACAERLATEWLDVARYSDSYGYQRDDERFVWPYRDWVIRAFAANMPYDQFVTWQLAGDLVDAPTPEQIVATTFNRLHSHKKEGGVALEEFRVENVADRTHTFAAAFMGLTLECARCHDHKYDPTKTKEYYQLSSFFANIDERGLISYFTDAVPTPAAPWPSRDQQRKLADAAEAVAVAERSYARLEADADKRFNTWVAETDERVELGNDVAAGLVARLGFEAFSELPQELLKNEKGKEVSAQSLRGLANSVSQTQPGVSESGNRLVSGKQGKAIELSGDDAVFLPGIGHFSRHQPFSVSLWLQAAELEDRGVIYRRSRGWDDAGSIGYELVKEGDRLSAKLVHFWPGNAICVETANVLKKDTWHHVVVTYDGSSKASGLRLFLDGSPAVTTVVQDHLTRTITDWREGYNDLAIGARYRDRGFKGGQVDEFMVFDRELSPIESRQLFDGRALVELLARRDSLSAPQREQLRDFYVSAIDAPTLQSRAKLREARHAWNAVMDSIPAITIMREQQTPRPAYVLKRGAYDQRGEEVTAGTPAFLPEFPDDAPRNRLGLARWITSADHPLMPRVTVNRYWQMVFGMGLVRTPEDFGLQGETPTHPELLDWLARDFIDYGWDVHRLLRQLVLSATYRQSTVVAKDVRDLDPENRLLARAPSHRLTAEMIRDNALAVSGLLCDKVGGQPVKPYDVALAYTPLPVDEGEALYRRSLYTFWKRTSPSPVMMTMNASKREVCRLRREVTDSPLQALVLLNGPQFVEASRVLAAKLVQRHGDDVDGFSGEAFRLLTSRQPSRQELQILRSLFHEQLESFCTDKAKAAELLKVGEASLAVEGLEIEKLAAATVLVNSIMNLDECVRNR